MAKIVVHKVTEQGKTNKGTGFWMCMGTVDGEMEVFKVWDEPQIGVEFDGEIKDNGKYGKSVSTDSGRGGGGGGSRYKRDPEVGNQIMRQNALEHATQIILKVADLTFEATEDKQEALKLAKEKMNPRNVIKVANLLFAYSSGNLNTAAPASSPAPAPAPKVPITKEAVTEAFPEVDDQADDPTPAKGQDVSPEDIPF